MQNCVIGANNTFVSMKLIKQINQMNYLHVILDFHDYFHFPNQMMRAYH
jgi:hypothetical protein